MKIVRQSIQYPISTAVGVILLVLFGTLSLTRLPIQLTPDVTRPSITVTTLWPGASPREVEREIIDEQEEQLKSLEGLTKLQGRASDSRAEVILTFPVGIDVDAALLRVANRLQQVPSYPEGADQPVITTSGANENAMAWFVLRATPGGFQGNIATLYDLVEDFVEPEFERVQGVANSEFFGGRPREMHVVVDPARLAARRITLTELRDTLERENRNYSAGDFVEGKRRYVVRTVGEYRTTEDIQDLVIAVRDGIPVHVHDVARAEIGYRKSSGEVFSEDQQVIAINAVRVVGANVLDVMEDLKKTAQRLNTELLNPQGLELILEYDQTEYIRSAIRLVRQSLLLGGTLAILILLLYLRSGSSTLVISVAIPVSIVGSFLMMDAFGRTLNVVSLAGLAFATGMVVDNSIVVLENIYRKRQLGRSRFQAADEGATEVWGAVLASTLTTVAVFLPVIFMQEEVGQLFGDIATAIACAVSLSLLVSLTVIPSLSARILRAPRGMRNGNGGSGRKGLQPARRVAAMVSWINRSLIRRLAVVTLLVGLSVGVSYVAMPKAEYLPTGNQNFLFGIISPPPGYSVEEVSSMRRVYTEGLKEIWHGSDDHAEKPGGGVQGFFFVGLPGQAFLGVTAKDPSRVRELMPELTRLGRQIPGTITVTAQSSIFESGVDEGRNIDINITGPDLEKLIGLGGEIFGQVMRHIPDAQARPIPSLDLGSPEVHVRPNRRRAADLGVSNRDLGFAVSALVDGALASDFQSEGKEIDLKVVAEESLLKHTHLLDQLPIATPFGQLVNLGSIADIYTTGGPTQINHEERQRAITIRLTPSEEMPLEEAMRIVQEDILQPIEAEGRLGGLYRASLSGTADKLTQAGRSLRASLLLAVVITYLLLSALFENFVYPLVIMVSVPLAAMGGFLGLLAVNAFLSYQALDVLTMLGFVILIGTVVNNAILIVHQSLNLMRQEGAEPRSAISEAVENRIRPIFMSVSTSVCGMLPLVLFPGAGSELYRGLGSVVIGGLLVSTLFTLFLVPALFSLVIDLRLGVRRLAGDKDAEPTGAIQA